jgi:hypothetical protein
MVMKSRLLKVSFRAAILRIRIGEFELVRASSGGGFVACLEW